ncbi:fucolectin [Elysia marginata]|uniref:Fucolectin n=1 Tax=Elysia marginata TaxID=1093978 RepID=A0AAV4FM40_9GAST|nr:fucolectin [Elysia marginata]
MPRGGKAYSAVKRCMVIDDVPKNGLRELCALKYYQNKGPQITLQKPTAADSIYRVNTSIAQPRFAVDGSTEPNVYKQSCFHSDNNVPSWWIVDLLRDYTIVEVKITNRDRFSYRLSNFTVDIFSGSQDPRTITNWPMNFGAVCHHQRVEDGHLGASETRTLTCNSPTSGRYVRVVKYSLEPLTICEVGYL